jgi:hypothetical protein
LVPVHGYDPGQARPSASYGFVAPPERADARQEFSDAVGVHARVSSSDGICARDRLEDQSLPSAPEDLFEGVEARETLREEQEGATEHVAQGDPWSRAAIPERLVGMARELEVFLKVGTESAKR